MMLCIKKINFIDINENKHDREGVMKNQVSHFIIINNYWSKEFNEVIWYEIDYSFLGMLIIAR